MWILRTPQNARFPSGEPRQLVSYCLLLSHKILRRIVGYFVGGIQMTLRTLTDREVKSLKNKPGMHRVAPGLYLRVADTGGSYWMLRYSVAGKATEMSLGRRDAMTLAEATAAAEQGVQELPVDPEAQYILAIVYQGTGRYADADKVLRELVGMTPNGKYANAIRENQAVWHNAKRFQQQM